MYAVLVLADTFMRNNLIPLLCTLVAHTVCRQFRRPDFNTLCLLYNIRRSTERYPKTIIRLVQHLFRILDIYSTRFR